MSNEQDYERYTCEWCGKTKVRITNRKGHEKSIECTAARNASHMIRRGFERAYTGGFINRVCVTAGLREESFTSSSRRGRRQGLEKESWVPKWVTKLLDDEVTLVGAYCGTSDAAVLYGHLIGKLAVDQDERAAVEAAHRMSGAKGVRTFVITPTMRAIKLREEALRLREAAAQKDREADDLDPPPPPGEGPR
jgi:hypothetical protein